MTRPMTIIKRRIERAFGVRVLRLLPHGFSVCDDIKRTGHTIGMAFDVGANLGQTADRFRLAFGPVSIHCFEPASATYAALEQRMSRFANVACHRLALGSTPGMSRLYLDRQAVRSSLMHNEEAVGVEEVTVGTVDSFASRHGIERIDLLKIDTEGFDLEVLKGAARMLGGGAIAFVLAEVGFHPGGKHATFEAIRDYLLPLGFRVYGVYDQQTEWSGAPRLRYANVCFCNEKVLRGD